MISERGEIAPGLIFVDEKTNVPSEIIALEYARKYRADAVYFRRFQDSRPPIPQIYIYDFTKTQPNEDDFAQLCKKLWNSGQVPLFFVFYQTEVKIFNCLGALNLDKDTGRVSISVFETIRLAADAKKEIDKLKDFSAKNFDNGSFWNIPKYRNRFNQKQSAYFKLLKELRQAKASIIKKKILPKKIAEKLLVMAILVKYLEEREDKNGSKVFPPGFFRSFADGDDFVGVLRKKGACLDLFDFLSNPDCFNGEIFNWRNGDERECLKNADLNAFADFFEGRLNNGQYTFWRLYSFNDLPIELISNIYEEFLESKKDGVVYTPPYLVNFLIDELMPLADFHKTDFRVIDPACGSGIFLVAAFRRMMQWWRIRNNWKKPDAENLDELKNILKNNIFGIDIHEEAVRLTFFSLSLALLDELSPKVIWENLKFDNLLEHNLIGKDFFELMGDDHFQPDFDAVIGNPPFISKLTPAAEKIENERIKIRPKLPDNQIALLFLEQGMTICKPDAWLCLILPAGPLLYNNNSMEFRKYFFEKRHVSQIIDFTFLDAILFESADFPTSAIFARKRKPDKKDILHITVRRTKAAREKLYFEMDHYDFHKVPYRLAQESRLVWKANLLGGGRLRNLLARFGPMRTLGEYLAHKEKNENWKIAEGFKIAHNKNEMEMLVRYKENEDNLSSEEKKRLRKLEKKFHKAGFLTGKKTLPTKAFSEKGIDNSKIYVLRQEYFHRSVKTKKEIFQSPHLLIKEGASKESIPIEFRSDDLSFRDSVIGVHAPAKFAEKLKDIEKRIKGSKTCLFYCAGFSGKYMVSRATVILKKDVESLPFPEDENELALSEFEQILVDDVLDYILDFRRKGEKSVAEKPVTDFQLDKFADIYCRSLNSVYKKFKPFQPLKTDSFICFPFYYKDKPDIRTETTGEIEDSLFELIQNNVTSNARIIRILRIYEKNVIYLVKPKQARYWLRSVAIRDADETFADLVAQGY